MMLQDEKGEDVDVGAGDDFHVRTAAGIALLEAIFLCDELSQPGKPMICCRLREGRLAVAGLNHPLRPPSIVYFDGEFVAAAVRASRLRTPILDGTVRFFDAH
jgi:hypothetical protein